MPRLQLVCLGNEWRRDDVSKLDRLRLEDGPPLGSRESCGRRRRPYERFGKQSLQALHHDGIKRGIIVIDLRHEAANMLRLLAHVFMLEKGALQRHRPTFADQPNVR